MSKVIDQDTIQKLIKARSDAYVATFNKRSVEGLLTWISKDVEFTDVALNLPNMDYEGVRGFFTQSMAVMSDMDVKESTTTGTPEFVAWELAYEVTYGVTEPAFNIEKGETGILKGFSLQWWRWEGEGEQWDGDLSEKGIRGWKIIKEKDCFVKVKGQAGKE